MTATESPIRSPETGGGESSGPAQRTAAAPSAWRRHLLAAGAIVVMAVLWFFPLFTGHSFSAVPGYQNVVYPWASTNNGYTFFPQSDQGALNQPLQSELTATLKDGTIPWWNGESFGGHPLFADGSSALLYPPRLVLAETVSPTTAHNVMSFLDVTLAGLFTYWLLVDLGLSSVAALFGAVAWMFGSFTLAWLQLEVVAPLFAWLPAGLVTMRRSILTSWRWVVGAGACMALLFVSTHLLFADLCVMTICLYGGCLALGDTMRRWRLRPGWSALKSWGRVAASASLGAGLAAFVLVPTAYVLSGIARQPLTFTELSKDMLLPFSDLRFVNWPPPLPVTATVMNFQTAFSGSLVAACGVVGIFLRRQGSGLGRGLVLGSMLVALVGPVSWIAFHLIPGMNVFRPYSRLLFLFDLGVAVLGAVGLDALMRAMAGRPPPATSRTSVGNPARTTRWWISRSVALVLVGLTAWQLGNYGRHINPPFVPSKASLAFPITPLIHVLQSTHAAVPGWPDRVVPNDAADPNLQPMLDANDALVFGIDSASGYDSAVPTRTSELWRVVGGEDPRVVVAQSKLAAAFLPSFRVPIVRYDLLPSVGVDEIAFTPAAIQSPGVMAHIEALGWKPTYSGADGSVFVWTGIATGPLVVFNAQHIESDATSLSTFASPGFDFRKEVILDSSGSISAGREGQANVVSAQQGVNTTSVTVQSSGPGYLVIPNMWDPGWSATVNGTPATVQRADFNEQAVAIPAGSSTVQLRYRPVGLTKGLVVSGLSVAACLLILVWPLLDRTRRRRPHRRSSVSGVNSSRNW